MAAVPDPYPVDDDQDQDVLDDESPTPMSRPEASRRKSKRDSAQPLEPLTAPPSADDPVVLDPMEVEPAPAEAERPRRERERDRPRRARGNSDAMGTLAGVAGTAAAVSGFKSMFGLGRKKGAQPEEAPRERRRTETDEDRKRRKQSTTRGGMTEDEAKRLRHERRSVRHPRAPEDEDVMMSGGNGGANGSTEYDPEREARRAERRAKRETDKGSRRAELEEAEAKAERRRERERDNERATLAEKKARQMAELERRNKEAEEQLRRMAEKDERRKTRGERKPTDEKEHRSSRRKDKDRPTNDRRRSHMDDDADRQRRHDERRAARRNSEYPVVAEPIADYFDERNAAAPPRSTKHRSSARPTREEENMPYLHKGPDKTSSWVQSLSDEPPLPPPISETVLDPAPGTRENPDDEETPSQDEDIRLRIAGRKGPKRDKERAERRKAEDKERDRERDRKHSSRRTGGEEEKERKKGSRRASYAPAYEEVPVRTWDGRPALEGTAQAQGKRGSWFKKMF
jgi:hypothetical protein